jgi:hypothetical protein
MISKVSIYRTGLVYATLMEFHGLNNWLSLSWASIDLFQQTLVNKLKNIEHFCSVDNTGGERSIEFTQFII